MVTPCCDRLTTTNHKAHTPKRQTRTSRAIRPTRAQLCKFVHIPLCELYSKVTLYNKFVN